MQIDKNQIDDKKRLYITNEAIKTFMKLINDRVREINSDADIKLCFDNLSGLVKRNEEYLNKSSSHKIFHQ